MTSFFNARDYWLAILYNPEGLDSWPYFSFCMISFHFLIKQLRDWPYGHGGLGNDFVWKRFAIQTFLWSLGFVIQINIEHDTIAVSNLVRSWNISTFLNKYVFENHEFVKPSISGFYIDEAEATKEGTVKIKLICGCFISTNRIYRDMIKGIISIPFNVTWNFPCQFIWPVFICHVKHMY